MYNSFEVKNFRCFKSLSVTNVKRVNLITGLNNVGKTALLEALFIHSGAYNPELTLRIDAFRGIRQVRIEASGEWYQPPWASLFNEFDTTKTIQLEGSYGDDNKRVVKLRTAHKEILFDFLSKIPQRTDRMNYLDLPTRAHILEVEYSDPKTTSAKYYFILDPQRGINLFPIPPPLPYQTIFVPAMYRFLKDDVKRFGELETEKKKKILLNALREIEPKLKDLALIVKDDVPLIHGDVGHARLMPLQLMGEGMSRLASITLAIGAARNGVALIDEVENGFHYSILPKVWQVIKEAARLFNTQLFLSTHSFECISAAHGVFEKDGLYDFSLHRLEYGDEATHDVTYDKETLAASIEAGLEVR
jgi:AAA15 family ATPase/GTPase